MGNPVDDLLSRIGTGKWNIFHFLVTAFASGLPAPHALAGAFVVPRQQFTCTQSSVSENPDQSNSNDSNTCSYSVRTEDGDYREEPCTEWEFDNSTFTSTVTAEFNLVCQKEYIRALYMSLYMIGVLVASTPMGYLADRFGRKVTFVGGVVGYMFLSIVSGWLPNIPVLLAFRFLIGICHVPVVKISYIMGMESATPEMRSVVGLLLYLPWSIYSIFFGGLGYLVRDWRWLLTYASLISLAFIPALCFVDESPHWLAVRGHYGQALKVLKKAARWNRATLPSDDEIIYLLKEHAASLSKPKEIQEKQSWISIMKNSIMDLFILFRTPRLRIISSVMHLNFFVIGMVYYGLAFSGGNFDIDIFSYMVLLGFTEIPSNTIMVPVVDRFGRKMPLVAGFLFTGISLLCITVVPAGLQWLVVTLAMVGRLNICVSSTVSYLIGSELFPTEVRTRGITYSFMMSRVGSSIAPFITEYLGYAYPWAPSVVFGGFAIVSSLASMALWETLGTTLPDTIAYLESHNPRANAKGFFGKKKKDPKSAEAETAAENHEEEQIQLKVDS